MSTPELAWFKSSYSGTQNDSCVEVATHHTESVHVRDSKDTAVPHLSLARDAWTAFLGHTTRR